MRQFLFAALCLSSASVARAANDISTLLSSYTLGDKLEIKWNDLASTDLQSISLVPSTGKPFQLPLWSEACVDKSKTRDSCKRFANKGTHVFDSSLVTPLLEAGTYHVEIAYINKFPSTTTGISKSSTFSLEEESSPHELRRRKGGKGGGSSSSSGKKKKGISGGVIAAIVIIVIIIIILVVAYVLFKKWRARRAAKQVGGGGAPAGLENGHELGKQSTPYGNQVGGPPNDGKYEPYSSNGGQVPPQYYGAQQGGQPGAYGQPGYGQPGQPGQAPHYG